MKSMIIPDSSGEVRDQMLKFKQGGPSVEEARAAMLSAREPASTIKGGIRVPKFIRENKEGLGEGGNTPVKQQHTDLLIAAKETLARVAAQYKLQPGTKLDLNKLRAAGLITQPEIDVLLADANRSSAPTVTPVVVEDLIEDVVEPVVQPTVEPTVQPVPTRVPVEPAESKKTVETKNFTGQIYRDGKDWVAELVYKNGSGTERFTASNKDDLMLKVLEGKGHGTIKVRETVQDYKRRNLLGDKEDTWDFFFNEVEKGHGLTLEQYKALPEASQDTIQDSIQAQQVIQFKENYPEYYFTVKNYEIIGEYLNKRKWPLTFHNLEIAYKDLSADDMLEERPVPVLAPPVAPVIEDSIPAVIPTPVVPTAVVVTPTAPVARKRGSTGLIPGASSAVPTESVTSPEEGKEPRELSEKELRNLPMADLKRLATQNRKYGRY